MNKFIEMKEVDASSEDAVHLINELSDILESITGDSGRNSFSISDIIQPRSLFVIAYDDIGEAVGCGGIRSMTDNIAEVKRMYAKKKGLGIGTRILHYLEKRSLELGYTFLRVETRLINHGAVSFYKNKGYNIIENYGKYVGRAEAVCFEKQVSIKVDY